MYVLDISSGDLMLTMLVGCPLSPLSYGSAVELYGAFQCNALLYIQLFQGLSVFSATLVALTAVLKITTRNKSGYDSC